MNYYNRLLKEIEETSLQNLKETADKFIKELNLTQQEINTIHKFIDYYKGEHTYESGINNLHTQSR